MKLAFLRCDTRRMRLRHKKSWIQFPSCSPKDWEFLVCFAVKAGAFMALLPPRMRSSGAPSSAWAGESNVSTSVSVVNNPSWAPSFSLVQRDGRAIQTDSRKDGQRRDKDYGMIRLRWSASFYYWESIFVNRLTPLCEVRLARPIRSDRKGKTRTGGLWVTIKKIGSTFSLHRPRASSSTVKVKSLEPIHSFLRAWPPSRVRSLSQSKDNSGEPRTDATGKLVPCAPI